MWTHKHVEPTALCEPLKWSVLALVGGHTLWQVLAQRFLTMDTRHSMKHSICNFKKKLLYCISNSDTYWVMTIMSSLNLIKTNYAVSSSVG